MIEKTNSFLFFAGIIFALACVLFGSGCAIVQDRGMLVTEDGLAAAEELWDEEFYKQLDRCKSLHPPKTEQAEQCFGAVYDADRAVDFVVKTSVGLLRGYWRSRAAGAKPAYETVLLEVHALIDSLPAVARHFFLRVRGVRPYG
jgi:hypothetical protein